MQVGVRILCVNDNQGDKKVKVFLNPDVTLKALSKAAYTKIIHVTITLTHKRAFIILCPLERYIVSFFYCFKPT